MSVGLCCCALLGVNRFSQAAESCAISSVDDTLKKIINRNESPAHGAVPEKLRPGAGSMEDNIRYRMQETIQAADDQIRITGGELNTSAARNAVQGRGDSYRLLAEAENRVGNTGRAQELAAKAADDLERTYNAELKYVRASAESRARTQSKIFDERVRAGQISDALKFSGDAATKGQYIDTLRSSNRAMLEYMSKKGIAARSPEAKGIVTDLYNNARAMEAMVKSVEATGSWIPGVKAAEMTTLVAQYAKQLASFGP